MANFKMAAVKSMFFPKCIIEHGFLKFRITSTIRVSNPTFYVRQVFKNAVM